MTELSAALERIRPLLTQTAQRDDTSNMQLPGCISEGGRSITVTSSESSQERQIQPLTRQTKPSLTWALALSKDEKGKQNIASFLVQCFNVLNVYGRDVSQLKDTVSMFIMLLSDYPEVLIKDAFKTYLKIKNVMPTPADIISILEEDNKRLLNDLFHLREGRSLVQSELDYIASKLGENWGMYV